MNNNALLVCNSEDRLTVVMRINRNDILINPSNDIQTIECIGKILSFYDKTIEIIITDDINSLSLINEYFKVKETALTNKVKINKAKITVEQNHVTLNMSDNVFHIFQRPVKQLLRVDLFIQKDLRIIRPVSDEEIEVFMKKIPYKHYIINDSTFFKFSF